MHLGIVGFFQFRKTRCDRFWLFAVTLSGGRRAGEFDSSAIKGTVSAALANDKAAKQFID
jgi:hypothetical protein